MVWLYSNFFVVIFDDLVKFLSVWNKFGTMNEWTILVWCLMDGFKALFGEYWCHRMIWSTIWHDLYLYKSNLARYLQFKMVHIIGFGYLVVD